MEYRELFETGMSVETFMNIASVSEREKMAEIKNVLTLDEALVERIKKMKGKYNFLLSAESWCPYVRATLPVLVKMIELNSNIKIGIITEGRGFKYLREKLGIPEEKYVVPTLAVLDENFNLVGRYIGRPSKYRTIGFENVSEEYFKGLRAGDIAEEILDRIGC